MEWLSLTLLPVSRGKQSKIHDRGLGRLVEGGYGMWNPNDGKLILLPAGQRMFARAQDYLLRALSDFTPQLIDTNGSARGSLDCAVRAVKRASDLPLLLAERREDRLELLGLHADLDACLEMSGDALRAVGSAICAFDLRLRRADRLIPTGHAIDLFCRAAEPRRGENGLVCPTCGWLAMPDSPYRAESAALDTPEETLREVATPNCPTIEALCDFLKVTPAQIVKCMIYSAEGVGLVAVIARGNRQVCLEKLRAVLRGAAVRPAEPEELAAAMGDSAGYMGPARLPATVKLLADFSAVGVKNVVIGANKKGVHLLGACWGRDFETTSIADLTFAQEGDVCPNCGAALTSGELQPIARFFPVDPAAAADESLTFFNGQKKVHVSAWSASIDLTALLSAVGESSPIWPDEFAAFDDYIYWDGEAPTALSQLVEALEAKGRRVIGDDRAGKKFADRAAEALSFGAPETIELKYSDGAATVQATRDGQTETLPLDQFLASL